MWDNILKAANLVTALIQLADNHASLLQLLPRRRKEQLKNMNSVDKLSVRNVVHIANSLCRLEIHHFRFMAQEAVKELHHGLLQHQQQFFKS